MLNFGHLEGKHSDKFKFQIFKKFIFVNISGLSRMTSNVNLDEKLEGADNFQEWKYRVIIILE